MLNRQRGALNLVWVIIFSGLFAAAAMAALFSMRYERNLFAELWNRVGTGAAVTGRVGGFPAHADSVQQNVPALRKCIIDGKTVVSNIDCTDDNKTSKTIAIHDSRGIEPPKQPAVANQAEPTSNPMIDKMVEKQLH